MRALARLLMFIGAFYALTVVSMHLKVPPTPAAYMAVGFLAALITWRLIEGK